MIDLLEKYDPGHMWRRACYLEKTRNFLIQKEFNVCEITKKDIECHRLRFLINGYEIDFDPDEINDNYNRFLITYDIIKEKLENESLSNS